MTLEDVFAEAGTLEEEIRIHEGRFQDCIHRVPDGSVDLVVMDPPYLIDTQGGGAFAGKNRTFDREFKDFSEGITNEGLDLIMSKMKAVNAYVWCNKAQLRQYLDYFEDRGCNTDLLMWHKSNPVPRCNNKYLSDTEYIVFARDPGVQLNGCYDTLHKYWITPVNAKDKKLYGHPTIKPLDIIKTLVENSSKKGDLVMDPFLGSGTTAVACAQTGRRFWGCEMEHEYFETSLKRVHDARCKSTLNEWRGYLATIGGGVATRHMKGYEEF